MPFTINKLIILKTIKQEYHQSTEILYTLLREQCFVENYENIEFDKLRLILDHNQLESKYGGDAEDLEEYWPPRCLGDATRTFDENSLIKHLIIPFTYSKEEFKSFCRTTNRKTIFQSRGTTSYNDVESTRLTTGDTLLLESVQKERRLKRYNTQNYGNELKENHNVLCDEIAIRERNDSDLDSAESADETYKANPEKSLSKPEMHRSFFFGLFSSKIFSVLGCTDR